jgi:hypothetical protein
MDKIMNAQAVLPRNKHDFERVEEIKRLDRNKIISLLPQLLEWVQDFNWPIASEIVDLLLTFPEEIVPEMKKVLATNDYIWKYWCLWKLIKELPLEYRELFKEDLNRLSQHPTDDEKLEELDEIAAEILQTL